MKKRIAGLLVAGLLAGCGGGGSDKVVQGEEGAGYALHTGITATMFWVGEGAGDENGYIGNEASAWDERWMAHFGGEDDPYDRRGWYPAGFVPKENPFYAALPYNDLDEEGVQKAEAATLLPWYNPDLPKDLSQCKNRWIAVTAESGKTVYVQWEDVGPFGESDSAYVFGNALPASAVNDHAGIDLSPAAEAYLGLKGMDKVAWRFVEASDVPEGPWKEIVTNR